MINSVLLFSFLSVIYCCTVKSEDTYETSFDLYKRLLISENCDIVAYAANDYNYFYPYLIRGLLKGRPLIEPTGLDGTYHFFPQSLSCDCDILSLIQKDQDNNGFDLMVYSITQRASTLIAENIDKDGGSSMFSPTRQVLAYLDNHQLYIYHTTTGRKTRIIPPLRVDFKNLNWSFAGKYIFLEDYAGDIWRYDITKSLFKLVWESSEQTFTADRLITPSIDDEEIFYFVSDQNSQFNQIYKFDSRKGVSKFIVSDADKFLGRRPVSEKKFYYRSNKNGLYIPQGSEASPRPNYGIEDKVVYDYFQSADSISLLLSAGISDPVSISMIKNGRRSIVVSNRAKTVTAPPKIIYDGSGIHHLVYHPDRPVKGWAVWLHGGPHEQVSQRYNPYIAELNNQGWGVIALNYPGSTGAGNSYEQNFLTDGKDIQLSNIRENIQRIGRKLGIKRYGLIGISYGSTLSNRYANTFKDEITYTIEISGTNTKTYPNAINRLYVFGTDDYVLNSTERTKLLTEEKASQKVQFLELQDEGHIISQRESQQKIIEKITDFLNHVR